MIRHNRNLGPEVFELAVSWSDARPEPGQFFMLRAARSGVLLGRPISVYDADESTVTFAIVVRGAGTAELAELGEGDGILIEGPLGSSWALEEADPSRAAGDLRDEGLPVALIGGGIGLAPILFLARSLRRTPYDLYAGFRSGTWGLAALSARRTLVFTEDGSAGTTGRVLDGFDASLYAGIYACGPEPMLRATAALAKAAGVPAWLSLERRMACGVGACLGCTVRTTKGNRRACVEGPIFRAEEVIFDE